MYNKKLYEISEKASNSIDEEEMQKRLVDLEKEVVKIIKKYSSFMDENGIVVINARSAYNDEEEMLDEDNKDYSVLNEILYSGRQKYFEEQYSLYYIENNYIAGYTGFSEISFIWNSIEYNTKYANEHEIQRILTRLKNKYKNR